MTKTQQILERVVVTLVEAPSAYGIATATGSKGTGLAVLTAAFAGGLSVLYNLLRQSKPTMLTNLAEQVIKDVSTPTPTLPQIAPVVTPTVPSDETASTANSAQQEVPHKIV